MPLLNFPEIGSNIDIVPHLYFPLMYMVHQPCYERGTSSISKNLPTELSINGRSLWALSDTVVSLTYIDNSFGKFLEIDKIQPIATTRKVQVANKRIAPCKWAYSITTAYNNQTTSLEEPGPCRICGFGYGFPRSAYHIRLESHTQASD